MRKLGQNPSENELIDMVNEVRLAFDSYVVYEVIKENLSLAKYCRSINALILGCLQR